VYIYILYILQYITMICNVSGITVLAHKVNPNKIDTYFQHGSSMMFTPLHPGFQLNNPLNLCKQVVVHNIIICVYNISHDVSIIALPRSMAKENQHFGWLKPPKRSTYVKRPS
jgi:hypothetical protein